MTRALALAFVVAWTVAVALLVIAVVMSVSNVSAGNPQPAQPAAAVVRTAAERVEATLPAPAPAGRIAEPIIGGRATWYPASGMIAAAGPALRHYLGRQWRGTFVSVCHGRCVVVQLSDWCLCTGGGGRLLDLSDDAFAQLSPVQTRTARAAFLRRGVIDVSITRAVRVPQLPATDTE